MSHTVLKAASDRASNYTLFNDVSGRLEVYWEQMCRPGSKEAENLTKHPKNITHEGYSIAPKSIAHEGYSIAPKDPQRRTLWFF
jgi:hypothetical protein